MPYLFLRRNIFTICVVVIFLWASKSHLFRILINPDATSRSELSARIDFLVIIPFGCLILGAGIFSRKFVTINQKNTFLLMFFFVILFYFFFSAMFFSQPIPIATASLYAIYFFSGAFLRHYKELFRPNLFFPLSSVLSTAVTIYFLVFSFQRSLFYFSTRFQFFLSPQLKGDILLSTEFANYVFFGLATSFCWFILSTQRLSKIISFSCFVFNLFLELVLLSVANVTIIISFGLTIFFTKLFSTQKKMLILIGCLFFLFSILYFYPSMSEPVVLYFKDKIQKGGGRTEIYPKLIEIIQESPILGIGLANVFKQIGYYPHNNILGLWSEFGVFGLSVYIFHFVIWLFFFSFTYAKLLSRGNVCAFVFLSFISYYLGYILLKGFVQDTWSNPIMFICSGYICGSCGQKVDLLRKIENLHLVKKHIGERCSKVVEE